MYIKSSELLVAALIRFGNLTEEEFQYLISTATKSIDNVKIKNEDSMLEYVVKEGKYYKLDKALTSSDISNIGKYYINNVITRYINSINMFTWVLRGVKFNFKDRVEISENYSTEAQIALQSLIQEDSISLDNDKYYLTKNGEINLFMLEHNDIICGMRGALIGLRFVQDQEEANNWIKDYLASIENLDLAFKDKETATINFVMWAQNKYKAKTLELKL